MGTGGFVYHDQKAAPDKGPSAGLAERIAQLSATLTPAERRICHVLTTTNMMAGLETILKLAQRANVSSPSIVRFTTKLGFDGFSAFQAAVSEDIQSKFNSSLDLQARASAHERSGLIKLALDAFHGSLERTLGRLDEVALKRVATLLTDGRRDVYCLGGPGIQQLSGLFWSQLYPLRPRVFLLRAGALPMQDQLIAVGRRDVVVVFDLTPFLAETLELAEIAKRRGAHIVLFTDATLSPVARIATDVLSADCTDHKILPSFVACLALAETVIWAVAERAGVIGRRRADEMQSLRAEADLPETGKKVSQITR